MVAGYAMTTQKGRCVRVQPKQDQTLPPHQCGATPILTERIQSGFHILRVECACGVHGASVFYRKPEDAERTRQSTVDGWMLAG